MKIYTVAFFCFASIVLTCTVSCKKFKKEKNPEICDTTFSETYHPDTIFPSPYIMAYPGSEWNYVNSNTDTTTILCSAWEQVAIVETSQAGVCVNVNRTHTLVPKLGYNYIHGENQLIFTSKNKTTRYDPLIATELGVFYSKQTNGSYSSETRIYSVDEIMDSMEVLGVLYYDVIHVHRYVKTTYSDLGGSGPTTISEEYYSKNVGLIRREYGYEHESYKVISNLVSYTIGPH